VRDERSQLYRIAWPDTGFSPPANLARCMDAAAAWAERSFIAEHRNLCVARRLKSLNFFWRSASPVRRNGGAVTIHPIKRSSRKGTREGAAAVAVAPGQFPGQAHRAPWPGNLLNVRETMKEK
jgi:hypothetical protein